MSLKPGMWNLIDKAAVTLYEMCSIEYASEEILSGCQEAFLLVMVASYPR